MPFREAFRPAYWGRSGGAESSPIKHKIALICAKPTKQPCRTNDCHNESEARHLPHCCKRPQQGQTKPDRTMEAMAICPLNQRSRIIFAPCC